MGPIRPTLVAGILVASLLTFCTASLCLASGFMISKMGGDLAGPTEPNAAAIFWNPAATGPIDGASLMLDLNFTWRSMEFERSWPDELDRGTRPDNPGRMGTFDVVPMAAFTVNPGLDWLTVGIGIYVPYGNRSDWPHYDLEAEKALPEDEREPMPPQAFHTLTGGIKAIYTTPTISLCPFYGLGVDWLWIGIGASWVHAEVDATRIKDFAPEMEEALGGIIDFPDEQMDNGGTATLDFSGNSYAFSFGIYAQPWKWLRLGISWTSGSKLVLPGRMRLNLPSLISTTFGAGDLVLSDGFLHMDLPPALRAGVHWDITDWLVFRVHMEYVHWSVYKDVRIHELAFEDENGPVEGLADVTEFISHRNYVNAVDVRAGFRFYIKPWWMIFIGAGYDANAIPDGTTTPDLYDAAKIGLAGGSWIQLVPLLEWMFSTELDRDDRVGLAIGATWVHFIPRQVDESQTDPPITGQYDSAVILLNTNLEARF